MFFSPPFHSLFSKEMKLFFQPQIAVFLYGKSSISYVEFQALRICVKPKNPSNNKAYFYITEKKVFHHRVYKITLTYLCFVFPWKDKNPKK